MAPVAVLHHAIDHAKRDLGRAGID